MIERLRKAAALRIRIVGDQNEMTDYEKRLAAQPSRALRAWERVLLKRLAKAADLPAQLTTEVVLDTYRVRDMLEGGMGSIRFNVVGRGNPNSVSELRYEDEDGVAVLFSLSLTDAGQPWEIDAWKVDFSPLRRPPSTELAGSGIDLHQEAGPTQSGAKQDARRRPAQGAGSPAPSARPRDQQSAPEPEQSGDRW